MLKNPCAYGVEPNKYLRYQTIENFTYWAMLGYFNTWNIIQFTNKTTSSEDFDSLNKVVLDGISENMASLL